MVSGVGTTKGDPWSASFILRVFFLRIPFEKAMIVLIQSVQLGRHGFLPAVFYAWILRVL